jgi:hypothetical protein
MSIAWPEFKEQYIELRHSFIPALLRDPEGAQCWKVRSVYVAMLCGDQLTVPADWVRLAGDTGNFWGQDCSVTFGLQSAVGKAVVVRCGGKGEGTAGKVTGFARVIIEERVYKLLMTQPLPSVQKCRVWHVLRLYHRLKMAGVTSEALAESVGSMLTRNTRASSASLADTINSVRLRCYGVSGGVTCQGFLRRSLDIFFRGGPWHFLLGYQGKWERSCRYPIGLLGPSLALHRHRLKNIAGVRFTWIGDDLVKLVRACSRKHLRSVNDRFDLASLTTAFRDPRHTRTIRDERTWIFSKCKLGFNGPSDWFPGEFGAAK